MKIHATTSPLAIRLLLAVLATLVSTSNATAQTANIGVQAAAPDGPYEQWKTINLQIECAPEDLGRQAGNSSGIDVAITTPSGVGLTIPTFQATEDIGAAHWECRFTPREVGTYSATIKGLPESRVANTSMDFDVSKSANGRGFLRVDRNQPYFMKFDNGDQFRGIGTNIGWEPRRRRNRQHTYDVLFPRISSDGLNTVRTWMCPWNMPLEWNSPQLGDYDEAALRRLDEMLALAEKNGLYVVLVLGYHGELQTVSGSFPNNDRWKENPYNVVNGGPCSTPADFFTNEQAKALYKKRLKLLVARVACHPHLMAWEFWNEIDHIERRGPVPGEAIVAWHEEMANYLHRIDAYDHPITTSISVKAPSGLWEIDDIDLIMLHPYGATDKLTSKLGETNSRFNKPAIAGEFSYSWKAAQKNERQDFERELRLGLWRGLMSPTPVLPMTWWWEYHDSHDDWRYFRPVANFSKRMTDLHDPNWKSVRLKPNHDSIECHGIAIGSNLFLWLRNSSASTVSAITIELERPPSGDYSVRQFDTVTGDAMVGDGISLRSEDVALTLSVSIVEGHGDTSFMISR